MSQCASDTDHAAEAAFKLGAKPTRVRLSFNNDGERTHMRYVEMLTHRLLLPCALLALHLEQLYILNLEALAKLRGLSPCGAIVDCLYFGGPKKTVLALLGEANRKHQFAPNVPVFQMTEETAASIPNQRQAFPVISLK